MGSIVDRHADPRRGLSPDNYTKEAMIHFNGPLLHEADELLSDALDRNFKGKKWHFHQTSAAGQAGPFSIVSKVMHRLSQERSKLPFLASRATVEMNAPSRLLTCQRRAGTVAAKGAPGGRRRRPPPAATSRGLEVRISLS